MSTVGHEPTDVSEAPWEALPLLLPPPTEPSGGPGRQPRERRGVLTGLCSVNTTGGAWRLSPTTIGQAPHRWLFAPWAARGPRGTRQGHTTPVGTAEPGAPARPGGMRGREPASQDGDARGGRRLGGAQAKHRAHTASPGRSAGAAWRRGRHGSPCGGSGRRAQGVTMLGGRGRQALAHARGRGRRSSAVALGLG